MIKGSPRGRIVALALVSALAIGCSSPSGPSGCSGAAVLSTLPVPLTAIRFVTPIGNMGPPVHTIPTDHVGIYLAGTVIPLVAPAKLRVAAVVKVTYLASPFRQGVTDYALETVLCGGFQLNLGHILTVPAKISNAAGTDCQRYSTANETVEQCRHDGANFELAEGESIGTVGAASIGAFDLGVYDPGRSNFFVNAARYSGKTRTAVCPYDSFASDLKTQLYAKIGDGRAPASGEAPQCGTMSVDVAGTARGVWVLQSAPVNQQGDESNFLVLAPYPLAPVTGQTFSVGPPPVAEASQAAPSFYPVATTGRVNRQFADVRADGLVYCYVRSVAPTFSFFVRLDAGEVLSLQKVAHAPGASPCAADPSTWVLGPSAVKFIR